MKNLSNNFNNHKFPSIVLNSSILLRLIHFLENLTKLRNWHIILALNSYFKKNKNKIDVLDLGCGSGVFSLPYAKKFTNYNFTCSDKNINNIHFVDNFKENFNLQNVTSLHMDIDNISESHRYNLIICTSVLNYAKNDLQTLTRIYDLLSDDGLLLLYLPINGNRVLPFYNYLYSTFFEEQNYNIANNECNLYSEKSLLKKLDQTGYTVNKTTVTYGFLGKLSYEIYNFLALLVAKSYILFTPLVVTIMIIILPIILILMLIDFLTPTKNGNGLLIIANKKVSVEK